MSILARLAVVLVASSTIAPAVRAAKPERERVRVVGVVPMADDAYVVVLKTLGEPAQYLPIHVGPMEAFAIHLRLRGEEPPRPMTLNLLESVLEGGRIRVVDISIDALDEQTFTGSVRLRGGGKPYRVDARPSDAIGLALGAKVPIWVGRAVLQAAAIAAGDLEDTPDELDVKGQSVPLDLADTL